MKLILIGIGVLLSASARSEVKGVGTHAAAPAVRALAPTPESTGIPDWVRILNSERFDRYEEAVKALEKAGSEGARALAGVIDGVVAQLGSDSFETREAASRRLARLAPADLARLEKVRDTTKDPEIRRRLRAVLSAFTPRQYSLDGISAEILANLKATATVKDLKKVMDDVTKRLAGQEKVFDKIADYEKQITKLFNERGKVLRPGFKYDAAIAKLEEAKGEALKKLAIPGLKFGSTGGYVSMQLKRGDKFYNLSVIDKKIILAPATGRELGGAAQQAAEDAPKFKLSEVFPTASQAIGLGRTVNNTLNLDSTIVDTSEVKGERSVTLAKLLEIEKKGDIDPITIPVQLEADMSGKGDYTVGFNVMPQQLGIGAGAGGPNPTSERGVAVQSVTRELLRILTDSIGGPENSVAAENVAKVIPAAAFTIPRGKD